MFQPMQICCILKCRHSLPTPVLPRAELLQHGQPSMLLTCDEGLLSMAAIILSFTL